MPAAEGDLASGRLFDELPSAQAARVVAYLRMAEFALDSAMRHEKNEGRLAAITEAHDAAFRALHAALIGEDLPIPSLRS